MLFQRPFQIFLKTFIDWVPSLDLVFGMLHEILESDPLQVLFPHRFFCNLNELSCLYLFLNICELERALKIVCCIIMEYQKLGHLLGIEKYPVTYVNFEKPAINPSDCDILTCVALSVS
jgi:hypothetical protein